MQDICKANQVLLIHVLLWSLASLSLFSHKHALGKRVTRTIQNVLQNICSGKFHKTHMKTPALQSEDFQTAISEQASCSKTFWNYKDTIMT